MQIKNNKNGKTAFGLVRDECPGCGAGDIGTSILKTIWTLNRMVLTNAYTDMSPSLFQALGASLDEGVLDVSWDFEKKGFQP